MNETTAARARLAALLEHLPSGAAILSAEGACLEGTARGVPLAAALDAAGAVRRADGRREAPLELEAGRARLIPFGSRGEWLLLEAPPPPPNGGGHEDPAAEAAGDEEALRRRLLRDVLRAATQDKLRLAFEPDELPAPLPLRSDTPLLADMPLSPLRNAILEAAGAVGIPAERAHGAALAAGEVAMNAVIHGGGGHARLGVAADTPGGGTVQLYVEDHGPGIALDALPQSALVAGYSTKNSMGMGFFLTLQESDRVFLRTGVGGTVVVVEVDRQPASPLWLRRAGLDLSDIAAAAAAF
jgi:anti-sigma regulatory factor (Ser/Thr protein kinase)